MSQLFARVELRGTSSKDVYKRLNAYMESKYWYTFIGDATDLPDSTYPGEISGRRS